MRTIELDTLSFEEKENTLIIRFTDLEYTSCEYYQRLYESIAISIILNSVYVEYSVIERRFLNEITAKSQAHFLDHRKDGRDYLAVRYKSNWYEMQLTANSVAKQLLNLMPVTFDLIKDKKDESP